ncbi:MAG: hypothetical protein C0617_08420 [Desulfuromonas sp.]|uniref:hypothetical protein n=1 Tax=Desulfuromonas sp. TaxID=892 RepID=UPI000CB5920A|nr:hypothetical protein [Desulfuromonas sp.]PLX84276.1 MAG: hypothetical protein C0617_08420 [Desulfuromonas sp.]
MSPLIPTPDTLPAHWGVFQSLLLLTFPLHLLLMNAALGAAAGALLVRGKGETGRRLSFDLARVLPLLIAFTVNFGVAPFLFVQVLYGHFIYPSSILMGVFWLSIVPCLIAAYYGAYLYDFRFAALGRLGPPVLAGSLALLLAIAFVFSNNMTLMLAPGRWSAYFDNPYGTLLNLSDPALWPRYLHMVTGALAVGGLFVALFGAFREKADPGAGELARRVGMRTFALLTVAQVPLGAWFLLALPRPVMLTFMGGNLLATALFACALLLIAGTLVAALRSRLALAAWTALPLVAVMTLLRAFVRSAYLREHFTLDQLQSVTAYGPMVLFFGSLLIGIAAIAWLVAKAAAAFRKPAPPEEGEAW